MKRLATAIVILLVLAGCGGDDGGGSAPDPYDVYLDENPDPELVLSRDDAQARALAGCGQEWAPGTIDRVLQDAYEPDC